MKLVIWSDLLVLWSVFCLFCDFGWFFVCSWTTVPFDVQMCVRVKIKGQINEGRVIPGQQTLRNRSTRQQYWRGWALRRYYTMGPLKSQNLSESCKNLKMSISELEWNETVQTAMNTLIELDLRRMLLTKLSKRKNKLLPLVANDNYVDKQHNSNEFSARLAPRSIKKQKKKNWFRWPLKIKILPRWCCFTFPTSICV